MFSVLIVDDNPSWQPPSSTSWYSKDFDTFLASSGAEALQILHEHPVDVLLTDVIMPEMDGVELYRRTRQAYPQLITVLMTAYAADELIQQGMAEGIKTVLTKPIDIDFLSCCSHLQKA